MQNLNRCWEPRQRGVLSSDNFSVYNGYPVTGQQKCLAHLRRHFLRLIKCPGKDNAAIGQLFVDLIDEVFDNRELGSELMTLHSTGIARRSSNQS